MYSNTAQQPVQSPVPDKNTSKIAERSVKTLGRKGREFPKEETLADLVFNPMTIRFENQNPDEKILMLIREHIILFWGTAIITLLGVFLPFLLIALYRFLINTGYFPFTIESQWWVCLIVLWYLYLITNIFRRFLTWFYNVNIMTTERFLDLDFETFTGYRVKECSLMKIQDAKDVHIGPWQMLFDMGDVIVYTASEDTRFEIPNAPSSSKVRDFIMDVVINEMKQYKSKEELINAP